MPSNQLLVTDVFDILGKLISYDTRTNRNQPGKEVLALYQNELQGIFESYGYSVEYVESNGHYSFLAIKEGKSPSILYSGHVDVVPWDDRWISNPQEMVQEREDGEIVLKGRGVSDMKSGIAALVAALPEISKSDHTTMFAITGDEEIGGEDGTKVIVDNLIERDKLPDYVITGDAAGMEIITRRRNVFDWYFQTKSTSRKMVGKREVLSLQSSITSSQTSHAAYFRREIDKHALVMAIEKMAELGAYPISIKGSFVKVNVIPNNVELEVAIPDDDGEELEVDDGLHHLLILCHDMMNIDFPTQAYSDYGINSTANVLELKDSNWSAQVDIRAMIDKDADELEGKVLLILDSIPWKFDIEKLKSVCYIATPDDSPLVKFTTKVLGELGYNDQSAERGGATDGRFFAEHNIPTIDIGAIGWNVHGPNETATKKSIEDLVKFFEKSISALFES